MKTGKYITALSVALLAAAGCTDDTTETVYKPYSTVVDVAADCELPVKFGEGDELYINRKPFALYSGNQINLHDAAPALEYLLYAPAPKSEEESRLVYTLPLKQTYVKNGIDLKSCPVFGITDNNAMNGKIELRPACGALKLSIPAPEDKGFAAVTAIKLRTYDYVLAGDITLDCTTGAVDWVGEASQAVTLSGSIDISAPEPEKAAKAAEGAEGGETPAPEEPAVHYTDVYFALPPMKIHDNLEVTMISSKGSATFNIDTKNKVIEQGKVLSVVPDSVKWTAAKSFYGKANCVLVAPGTTSVTVDCTPYMTTSTTYAYQFNEGTKEAASAGVLWNDVSTTFITNVQLAANHKSFTATLDGEPGNAVVAIYDNSGTVLWSFHIWVTEHADHDYGTNDFENHYIVMDRNLGATSATPYDGRANGLLYEWGRKDPFVGGDAKLFGAKGTREIYNESGTCTFNKPQSGSTSRDLQWAIANPMTYLTRAQSKNSLSTMPYRFNNDWLVYGDNALWGNPEGYNNPKASTLHKSIYDPCPEGYMVAPNDVWCKNENQSIFPGKGWTGKDEKINNGYLFEYNGNTIWYPAAGLYNRKDGKIQEVGINGSTQKSCPLSAAPKDKDCQNSGYIIISGNTPTFIGKGNCRGNAYSVRCVKETAAEKPAE